MAEVREEATEDPGQRRARLIAGVVCAFLAFDLTLIIVTGGASLLNPSDKVGVVGFVARELLLALAAAMRFRLLASSEKRLSAGKLFLGLAIIPVLFHVHFMGRRITGDAVYYYVYTRSMMRDADVDFANEYEHYALLTRGDFSVPTDTGHRRSIYSVGPGLLWTPFFAAADGLALCRAVSASK